MSVEARDFLRSAQAILCRGKLEEIDYRNIASRAYYAVYHHCRVIWESLPEKTNISASHDRIIRDFLSIEKYKTLGQNLKRLRDIRHRADYELSKNFSYHDASRVAKEVEKILDKWSI